MRVVHDFMRLAGERDRLAEKCNIEIKSVRIGNAHLSFCSQYWMRRLGQDSCMELVIFVISMGEALFGL